MFREVSTRVTDVSMAERVNDGSPQGAAGRRDHGRPSRRGRPRDHGDPDQIPGQDCQGLQDQPGRDVTGATGRASVRRRAVAAFGWRLRLAPLRSTDRTNWTHWCCYAADSSLLARSWRPRHRYRRRSFQDLRGAVRSPGSKAVKRKNRPHNHPDYRADPHQRGVDLSVWCRNRHDLAGRGRGFGAGSRALVTPGRSDATRVHGQMPAAARDVAGTGSALRPRRSSSIDSPAATTASAPAAYQARS
jgi:hypothetical protein